MKTIRNLVASLTATLLAAAGVAHAAPVREGVRVARARGTFVHQRVALWISAADGLAYEHDETDVLASLRAGDGRYAPAYLDDSGIPVEGRRWVPGPSGVEGEADQRPDPRDVVTIGEEESLNVKTTVGIDFTFLQTYSTTPGGNGLNYIALSNDSLTENSASTTLSTEIAANGLTRAQGTYAHTTAASTATISKTFTATGAQSCQKAALFSASSSGTMHHVLSFTQRSLVSTDTIAVTFTITIT